MLYKVVLNGQAFGQDIKNILYYRTGLGIEVGGLFMAGAQDMADAVHQQIWPALRACVTSDYYLQSIFVYPYNQEFRLAYQNPYEKGINEAGTAGSNSVGPAACFNIRFNLEPTSIVTNGPKPPKRGYIAVGPISRDWIGDSGLLIQDNALHFPREKFEALTEKLAGNIGTSFFNTNAYFPVRVRVNRVLGGLVAFESFADVNNAVVQERLSYRRSRIAE
jgi:hypothetical protein